jgi:ABC-type uncharacterized transport system substrate-binding protein
MAAPRLHEMRQDGIEAAAATIPVGIFDGLVRGSLQWRRGLQEAGYVEGRDIAIESRSSEGEPGQLAAVAADLVNLSVDVIVTYGSAPTRAAQQATTTPTVIIAVGDP